MIISKNFQTAFMSVFLIIASIVLSVILTKTLPAEVFIDGPKKTEIIILEKGLTPEEYEEQNKNEWKKRVEELKKEDAKKGFHGILGSIKKRGLIISWLPWLLIPIFLYIGKREIYIVVGVLAVSMLIGFVSWFEVPVFIAALCLGILLKKKKDTHRLTSV